MSDKTKPSYSSEKVRDITNQYLSEWLSWASSQWSEELLKKWQDGNSKTRAEIFEQIKHLEKKLQETHPIIQVDSIYNKKNWIIRDEDFSWWKHTSEKDAKIFAQQFFPQFDNKPWIAQIDPFEIQPWNASEIEIATFLVDNLQESKKTGESIEEKRTNIDFMRFMYLLLNVSRSSGKPLSEVKVWEQSILWDIVKQIQ